MGAFFCLATAPASKGFSRHSDFAALSNRLLHF